ncbi:alpha/beta hydrolase [Paenibacillus kobensis]|uniref:alpha/beta hydrolase n=1 Tax=Paenibacillus kobensis TaxID=59841 RepID=UPI000FD97B90|nr:alpha/beta hydrolase [Paenibacillus kobensis]
MWQQVRLGREKNMIGIIQEPNNPLAPVNSLIVLLPGLGQAMSEKNYMFSSLRKELVSSNCRVVQFDYRGHGDSAGNLENATITTMIEDTVEVINEVNGTYGECRKIMLVGHALGAVIAIRAAAQITLYQPDIICDTILISPPLVGMPSIYDLFDHDLLRQLALEKFVDTSLLAPGVDYYTLSDFDERHVDYFLRLGAHMIYLHGQCLSETMLKELDSMLEVTPETLSGGKTYVFIGERDDTLRSTCLEWTNAEVFQIPGVTYYFQHPKAMDWLVEAISGLIQSN